MGAKNKLTIRQRKFVEAVPTSKSLSEAARKAGYSLKSCHVAASRMIRNDNVQTSISALLDAAGLSDEHLATSLNKAINYGLNRPQTATVSDSLRGVELALRVKDRFPSEKHEVRQVSLRAELETLSLAELKNRLVLLEEETRKYTNDIQTKPLPPLHQV